MVDKLCNIQIDYPDVLGGTLQLNGQKYTIAKRGLLVKHKCLVGIDKKVLLTIKKRGEKNFRLVFANGHKYQLEVLTYSTHTYVFYDKEDTDIFRISQPVALPGAICLLISEVSIPEEEFVALVAWDFYSCWYLNEKQHYHPAA